MSNGVDPVGRPVDYERDHSEREFERLDQQARIVGPFTRQVFRDAGIVPASSRGCVCLTSGAATAMSR